MTTEERVLEKNLALDWILRLVKGAIIGVGAIVPGLSGGVLAVIFGLYNPLMHFLGNLHTNFHRNLLFFLPVGIGLLAGGFIFSAVVDVAFSRQAALFTWLFVGFITGTIPALFRTAGERGRRPAHWLVLIAATAATLAFMLWFRQTGNVNLEANFWNWLLAGGMVGLGVVLPGMSPSNFLIYLGLYQPMAHGISHINLAVLAPLTLGVIASILAFAKVVSWLFQRSYTSMYHIILGVVTGSTLAILPMDMRGWQIPAGAALFAAGLAGSFFLARLDEKYPHDFAGA